MTEKNVLNGSSRGRKVYPKIVLFMKELF